MSDALRDWVKRLSDRPLPVWRESRRALLALTADAAYNGAALIRAAAHDPMLCAHMLRAANAGRADGSIATLEQAAVMLGAQAMTTLAQRLPVLEDRFDQTQLAPLRQLHRRAFHIGYLARELVRRHRDMRYDDAFYAGLLRDLGELALRAHAPEIVPRIRHHAAKQGSTLEQAARAALGCGIAELSAALAEHWRLPHLLRSLLDDRQQQDRRCELIRLAEDLIKGGPERLLPEIDNEHLRRAGEILVEPPDTVRTAVFKATAEAAAHLYSRLPRPQAGLVELFPAEPLDSYDDAAATAEPTAPAPAGASAASTSELQQVLERFTDTLRDDLGFDRVVFALLSADHGTLRGRFFRGVAADAALRRFVFQRDGGNLFGRLLERPAAVWVHAGVSERLAALLTPALRQVVEVDEFVAQSIFVHNRPIGICYADRRDSRQPLGDEAYTGFRRHCAELAAHLTRLSGLGLDLP